ncbi:MAG: glycosyltransferase family 39 protein [Opitutae bacterium]|nr:glycosyltransferase family 39 protein [Opitutae bacterium]
MHLPPYAEIPVRLALLLAGLLLPGSMLLRALRLPWSLAAAFASSAATLYVAVLVFAWTGAVISLLTLAAALALVTLLARLVPARASQTQISSSFASFAQMGWWLPLYGAFWLVVAWRLGFQPLNGPDVTFRWSWLAEQMLRFGSLDFYPPRSGADFVKYFWAESIPPGLASLYAWAYACAGSKQPLWTSPVVALQLLAVHELIWRLASRWGGEAVARRAVLLAAACPLLTWSVTLGQETGLIALAVTGLVWSLHHLRDRDGNLWAVLAGLFAAVAASTREYGVIFPVVAITALIWLQAPRRQIWLLALIALPVALAWPLRVWLLTGNPVYSLNVAGLFAVNPVFTAWNDALRGPSSHALASGENWLSLGRYLLLWALPAVAGVAALVMLLVQRLREARLVAVFVVLGFGLWLASVAYTAGGLFYSLRVLSPALALLVFIASYGLGFAVQHPAASRALAAAVALMVLESLPKTLALPENPYHIAVRDWPQAAGQFPAVVRGVNEALLAKLQPLPDRRRIVSDHAGLPRVLGPIGTEVLPLWSPEVAWLFDEKLPPEEIARRWQKSGLRYLVLGKTGATAGFVPTHARWRAPWFTLRTVAETDTHVILEAIVATALPK